MKNFILVVCVTFRGVTRELNHDEAATVWLDMHDAESPDTLAYRWAHGGCYGAPEPTVPRPVATPVASKGDEIRAHRAMQGRALGAKTRRLIAAMRSKATAFQVASRSARERAQARTSRANPGLRDYVEHYCSTSEGLADTHDLSDDVAGSPDRYSIEVLRTGLNESCACRCDSWEKPEFVGNLGGNTYVCGLCGHLWRVLEDDDQMDWDLSPRWSHVADAHDDEWAWNERYLYGGNPQWQRAAQASRARYHRYRATIAKVRSMPIQEVRRAVFSARKNKATIAANEKLCRLLGLSAVPHGAWPGVKWDATLKTGSGGSLVREYQDGNLAVRRVPDMTECYLTRKQLDRVTAELNARLKG